MQRQKAEDSPETEELEKRAEETACTHSVRKEKIVFSQK